MKNILVIRIELIMRYFIIVLVDIELFNEIFIKLTVASKNNKFNDNFATMRK